jgi:hypothetical protein
MARPDSNQISPALTQRWPVVRIPEVGRCSGRRPPAAREILQPSDDEKRIAVMARSIVIMPVE